MAEANTSSVIFKDDLDDMVYVSDGSENSSNDNAKLPSLEVKPGMLPEVQALYPGKRDVIVTGGRPGDLPEPEEKGEDPRYALVIRYVRCNDGHKKFSISSILVQSPLLRKVLAWVLRDRYYIPPKSRRPITLLSPFTPFVHRWLNLFSALVSERDPETKSHIQLLYDTLSTELDLTLKARSDFVKNNTITFDALWMIFAPGDIVFHKWHNRQSAAKIIISRVHSGKHEDFYRLGCKMVHWDGNSFGWETIRYKIPKFVGPRKIDSLPVYPLQFHHNVEEVCEELRQNGKAYERLLGVHHKQYQGLALTGLKSNQHIYVDSRIIIDFEAYMRHNPDRTALSKPLEEVELPARYGSEYNVVKGYSLRDKCWLEFYVDNVHDIEWNDNAWDKVVLDGEQKDLIFSVTQGHRLHHQGLKTAGLNILISGPTGVGKTLTVKSLAESLHAPLFHLTSSDIRLDAGDHNVESRFTDILEMCGKWNAMILFDEAEGPFSNKPHKDHGRNYLLLLQALEQHSTTFFITRGSFAEDPYTESLILNRSHLTFNLPPPTAAMRQAIWQNNIECHKDLNFIIDIKALAEWSLNGRDITNAVTTAKTLTRNGNPNMQHLERVVPASKRVILKDPVAGDVGGLVSRLMWEESIMKMDKILAAEKGFKMMEPTMSGDSRMRTCGIKMESKESPISTSCSRLRGEKIVDKAADDIRKSRTPHWVSTGPPKWPMIPSSPPPVPPYFTNETSQSSEDPWIGAIESQNVSEFSIRQQPKKGKNTPTDVSDVSHAKPQPTTQTDNSSGYYRSARKDKKPPHLNFPLREPARVPSEPITQFVQHVLDDQATSAEGTHTTMPPFQHNWSNLIRRQDYAPQNAQYQRDRSQ
ncbi:MAG: hypothetical protein Q9226_002030 [Calogaya cf. arnoldii]